jgi:hypothetical protein
MTEILSLNHARKVKAKVAKRAQAEANRARFGRTKAEKDAAKVEAMRRESLLDGAKRDD